VIGLESLSVFLIIVVTSLAIISSGYLLGLGTERIQFVVSQVLALTLLAIIQTLPEYSVEAVLSYTAAFNNEILHYVTANLTGANRLLIGLGWPAVFIVSYFAGGRKDSKIEFDRDQSVSIVFLGIATLYSFIIFLKGTLNIFDGVILSLIFVAYAFIAIKLPASTFVEEKANIPLWVAIFFLLVGMVTVFLSAEPFVYSMIETGKMLNINEYLLIQWLAPVISEAPEGVTVMYWSLKAGMGRTAIANLISSKVTQWTLLFALIPLVYTAASGSVAGIKLTPLQGEEILLTAAQSLFGFLCLSDMKLSMPESLSLLLLFSLQFVLPETRFLVSFAYLGLSIVRIATERERNKVFKIFSLTLKDNVLNRGIISH
jgi:cation:H+ antiporter